MFCEQDQKCLEAFVRLSHAAGNRSDYIQGGGGNTSVKLENGRMAIKASGYRLSDVDLQDGFAVLDYMAIRKFYRENNPKDFADVEAAGADQTKKSTLVIEGLKALRPSVEAGFHSILRTYVLHTHSVYANLAACSQACREIAGLAFSGADYAWGWVEYTDPGAKLTFAIGDELARVQEKTGKQPSVILMQNHGIIVHDDDPDVCLSIHADANRRLAAFFGLTFSDFPKVVIREMAGGLYAADTPYLREQLRNCKYTQQMLMEHPLYPDQMVFLNDTFFLDMRGIPEGQAVASTKTGELLMNMDAGKAKTLTETLTAVFFVMEHIADAGYTVSTMGDAAKAFISGWESEKYRKSVAGKKE